MALKTGDRELRANRANPFRNRSRRSRLVRSRLADAIVVDDARVVLGQKPIEIVDPV